MASVEVSGLTHHYPTTFSASIDNVSFTIADGECFGIVGPIGAGKTTLLRLLSGAERPSAGSVWIDGRDVTAVGPNERRVSRAFERHRLYPHMTVAENLGFTLILDGLSRHAARTRLEQVAERVGIERDLDLRPPQLTADRMPFVSMARALINDPQVILVDDPVRGLEPEVRAATLDAIRSIHERLELTAVYASSRIADARAVCDRIALLSDGRITGVYGPGSLPASQPSVGWAAVGNDAIA